MESGYKTGDDPTPFLTKENSVCSGNLPLVTPKGFWRDFSTSSYLHLLPSGVHIRTLKQSTRIFSLPQQPHSAHPTLVLPSAHAHSPSQSQGKQSLSPSTDTEWLPQGHQGSKCLQELHVLPCSLPPFIGERVFDAFCPEPRAVPVHTIFALLRVRWINSG